MQLGLDEQTAAFEKLQKAVNNFETEQLLENKYVRQ